MAQEDSNAADEVNKLYWETDRPVSRLAEELGVTRRTVYDTLRPQPTGVACPECGEELVHRHRSARDAGEADCPACGREGEDVREAAQATTRRAGARARGHDHDDQDGYETTEPSTPAPLDTEAALLRSRALLLAGAGVLGAMIGATVVALVRRA